MHYYYDSWTGTPLRKFKRLKIFLSSRHSSARQALATLAACGGCGSLTTRFIATPDYIELTRATSIAQIAFVKPFPHYFTSGMLPTIALKRRRA